MSFISDGGMAVTLSEQMSVRWAVDVRFELPGIPEMLEVKGEFAWSDGGGQAGIRFIYVSIESKRRLGKWLSQQIEEPDTGRTPGKANGRRSVPSGKIVYPLLPHFVCKIDWTWRQ